MPKCDSCGTSTKVLHHGGDARIPGDGIDSGVCDSCQVIIARAVVAVGSDTRAASAKAYAARLAGTLPAPAPLAPAPKEG